MKLTGAHTVVNASLQTEEGWSDGVTLFLFLLSVNTCMLYSHKQHKLCQAFRIFFLEVPCLFCWHKRKWTRTGRRRNLQKRKSVVYFKNQKIITSLLRNPQCKSTSASTIAKKVSFQIDRNALFLQYQLFIQVTLHLLGTHPLWGHLLWNAAVVISDVFDSAEFAMAGRKCVVAS
jgi:hypothetical protein